MLRILKYLSKAEIGQMLIALVTIVGQVYFDLKLPDYIFKKMNVMNISWTQIIRVDNST